MYDTKFADKVADVCYEKFDELPKSGKPTGNEWTTMAAVVAELGEGLEIISMATGSKCIGQSKMTPLGDVINDSHAEVLARRGFIRFMYHQIELIRSSKHSRILKFNAEKKKYNLRSEVRFHLFSSHVPCGDASIFPKNESVEKDDKCLAESTFICSDVEHKKEVCSSEEPVRKKIKIDNIGVSVDIHRTGAKCLAECERQDQRLPGANYHIVGVVRTKPGRGDRTLSVSCSDKLLRWNTLGIQGALLALLMDPVYLDSIVIAGSIYSHKAMYRAVIARGATWKPTLLRSERLFKYAKHPDGRPAPSSIIWCDVPVSSHEVCVNGMKLGATKSKRCAQLSITKKSFLNRFRSLVDDDYNNLTYGEIKLTSTSYQEGFKRLKKSLKMWTVKDSKLLQFM